MGQHEARLCSSWSLFDHAVQSGLPSSPSRAATAPSPGLLMHSGNYDSRPTKRRHGAPPDRDRFACRASLNTRIGGVGNVEVWRPGVRLRPRPVQHALVVRGHAGDGSDAVRAWRAACGCRPAPDRRPPLPFTPRPACHAVVPGLHGLSSSPGIRCRQRPASGSTCIPCGADGRWPIRSAATFDATSAGAADSGRRPADRIAPGAHHAPPDVRVLGQRAPVRFYSDGYWPSLGQDILDPWCPKAGELRELWDIIGPQIALVMRGGRDLA